MESSTAFGMFNRKHHCRTCGGIFTRAALVSADPQRTVSSTVDPQLSELARALADMGYARAVWVCKPCANGTKVFSRWLVDKEPSKERVPKGLMDATADRLRSSIGNLLGSGKGSPTGGGGGKGRVHVQEQLIAIYELHAPHKLNDIDQLMAEHRGKEKELLAKVVAKWGAVPKPETRQGRLAREWLAVQPR
jgi:hypothetical protein